VPSSVRWYSRNSPSGVRSGMVVGITPPCPTRMSRTPSRRSRSAAETTSDRVSWVSPSVNTTSTRSATSDPPWSRSRPCRSAAPSSVPPAVATSGSSPSINSCNAPPSIVSGDRMKLCPANAMSPNRSPARSCTSRRASRCARPRRDGVTSSANIELEMSMANTRSSAFDSVRTVRRPHRGPASAMPAANAPSPSARGVSRPTRRAARSRSVDQRRA